MVVKTRSTGDQLPSTDANQSQQEYSNRIVSASDNLSAITATLDTMKSMLDNLTATTDFEKGIKTYLALLQSQVCEARAEHARLRDEQARLRDEVIVRNRNVRESVNDLTLNVVKTEQYSRRDTITVVGLPKPAGTEAESDLCNKVADVLSACGETVTADDLSVAHRNSKHSKVVRGNITIPPSVTVRFAKISKKDSVLRGYRNYDQCLKKPREVRVYQSLTSHYSSVRNSIVEFFKSGPDCENYGDVFNHGLKLKWATYQSPTSGFAVKLDSAVGEYMNGIHLFQDFLKQIYDKFPSCRRK